VGGQRYPPGCCVGPQDILRSEKPTIIEKFPHCVEFQGKRVKHFMNLNLGELHALLEKLYCLVCARLR
jgi:hypothetical protein